MSVLSPDLTAPTQECAFVKFAGQFVNCVQLQ
jgi:hypothetical protein